MTAITEHPTREGKLYCAVVLDAFSRMIVGRAIDTTQTRSLKNSGPSLAFWGGNAVATPGPATTARPQALVTL
jgi:putative transposase